MKTSTVRSLYTDKMVTGVSYLVSVILLQSYIWQVCVLLVTILKGIFWVSEPIGCASAYDVLHDLEHRSRLYLGLCLQSLKAWIAAGVIIWAASGHKQTSRSEGMHLNRDRACSLPLDRKEGSCEMKVRWNMFSSWHGTKACLVPKIFLLLIMHVSDVCIYQCPGKFYYQCWQMESILNNFRNNILSHFKVCILIMCRKCQASVALTYDLVHLF